MSKTIWIVKDGKLALHTQTFTPKNTSDEQQDHRELSSKGTKRAVDSLGCQGTSASKRRRTEKARAAAVKVFLDIEADAGGNDEEYEEEHCDLIDDADEELSVRTCSKTDYNAWQFSTLAESSSFSRRDVLADICERYLDSSHFGIAEEPTFSVVPGDHSHFYELLIQGDTSHYYTHMLSAQEADRLDVLKIVCVTPAQAPIPGSRIYVQTALDQKTLVFQLETVIPPTKGLHSLQTMAPSSCGEMIGIAEKFPQRNRTSVQVDLPSTVLGETHKINRFVRSIREITYSEWTTMCSSAAPECPRKYPVLGQWIRFQRSTKHNRYKGDLGMVVRNFRRERCNNRAPQMLVAFVPRLSYGTTKDPGASTRQPSLLARDRRPPLAKFFDVQRAMSSTLPLVSAHLSSWPRVKLLEYEGQKLLCDLSLIELSEEDWSLLSWSPAKPTEEELIHMVSRIQRLDQELYRISQDWQGPGDSGLFSKQPWSRPRCQPSIGVIANLTLKNLRLAKSLRPGLSVYVQGEDGIVIEATVAGYESNLGGFHANTYVTVSTSSTSLETTLQAVNRRWEIGEFVRFLSGSQHSHRTGFVVFQNQVNSVYCLLMEDPSRKNFFRRLAGIDQDAFQADDVVEVQPWEIEVEPLDTFETPARTIEQARTFETTPSPTYPTSTHQQAVDGIIDALSHAIVSEYSFDFRRLLLELEWDGSNSDAVVATTMRIKQATNEFLRRRSAKRTWQEGRQVKILNVIQDQPTTDERLLMRMRGSLATVQSASDNGKCVVVLENDATRRPFCVADTMLYDTLLCMSLKDANLNFAEWRKSHGDHIASWLHQRTIITNPIERSRTPPHPPTSLEEGHWYHLPPQDPLQTEITIHTSHPIEAHIPPYSQTSPQVSSRLLSALPTNLTFRPPSPHQNHAFSQQDIDSWPIVDWSFISDAETIFTNNFLSSIRIRIAVSRGVEGVAPESLDSVFPGRNGWLVGYTDDRTMAVVQFQHNGNHHKVPFRYLSNGPIAKNKDLVVVIRDVDGRKLIGRHGYFLKYRNLLALGSKDYRAAMIADRLSPSFATKEKALVLWKELTRM